MHSNITILNLNWVNPNEIMNSNDIARQLAEDNNITIESARAMVKWITTIISDSLLRWKSVTLPKVWRLEVKNHSAWYDFIKKEYGKSNWRKIKFTTSTILRNKLKAKVNP